MDQIDSSIVALVVANASYVLGGIAGDAARAVFPSLSSGPDARHHCRYFLRSRQAHMLDIMAGLDQKNSYVVLPCHDAEAVSRGPDCSADS